MVDAGVAARETTFQCGAVVHETAFGQKKLTTDIDTHGVHLDIRHAGWIGGRSEAILREGDTGAAHAAGLGAITDQEIAVGSEYRCRGCKTDSDSQRCSAFGY